MLREFSEITSLRVAVFTLLFCLVVADTPPRLVRNPASSRQDGQVMGGKRPMNVDYILKFLASGAPERKQRYAFEEIRSDRRKRDTDNNPPPDFPSSQDMLDKPIPVAAGPGWVEVRLPRSSLKQPVQHQLRYRPEGQSRFFSAAPVRFARRWGRAPAGPLLSMPLTPCPSWVTRDQFCILLTDNIAVGESRFVAYEAQLITKTIHASDSVLKEKCANGSYDNGSPVRCENHTKFHGDLKGKKQETKVTLNFTFRILDCDPTVKNKECRDIGKYLGIGIPDVQEMESSPFATVDIMGFNVPYDWAKFMRKLWPLYLALVVVMLVVGLPFIFIKAKRIAEREALLQLFSEEQMITAIANMRRLYERASQGG